MNKEWFIKEGGQVCLKAENGELNGWDTQSLIDCLNGKETKIKDLETKLAQAQKTIEIFKTLNEALMEENLDYSYDITDTAYEYAQGMAEDWEQGYKDEILELKSELALIKKALELAVVDKCEFENKFYSMAFGIANGKLPCPKREQWYKEQAEKEMMKSE